MSQHRNNNFNLLRFIFATMVVVAHAPQLLDNGHERDLLFRFGHTMDLGQLAVDFFFILSGHLIVQSWKSDPSIRHFLVKRVRRIFPGFLVASIFCAFVVGPIAASSARDYFAAFSLDQFALGAVLLQKPVTPPVFAGTSLQLNGSMWTIAPEFICYLAVLTLGLLGFIKHRRLWALATAIVVAAFVVQRFEIHTWLPDYWLRFAGCFTMGGLFFLYKEKIPKSDALALFACAFLAICQFSWRLSEIAVLLAAPYLIFHLAEKQWRSVLGFNKLPDVSYGIYLYSFPIQALLAWWYPHASPWALLPIAMIAATLAGTLSWYAVEQPMLRRKRVKIVQAT